MTCAAKTCPSADAAHLDGAVMGLNWILLFEAYRYTTVSAATLSYYASQVIVTMLCPVFFHENLTKKQVLCFVMSTAGVTYCLYFSALKELRGQEAAILSYIDPAVAVVISVLVLGEGITGLQVIGGILIIGFAVWNEV